MSSVCIYCKKKFKSNKSKKRHEYMQICLDSSKRTYCSHCDYMAENKEEFKNHLISSYHLSNISKIKTRNIKFEKSIINLDPYLNDKEKNELLNPYDITNLTLKYNNNILSKIDIKEEKKKLKKLEEKKKIEEEERKKIENDKHYVNGQYIVEPENKCDYESILNAELYTIPPKTDRQKRILLYLIKCQEISDIEKKNKLKEILRLISLEDANYLMSHIRRCDEINIISKQFYMNFIDKFAMELIKLYNDGIIFIGNKNINEFVLKITK